MKQRKKIRDGIGLYPPSEQKTRTIQKEVHPLLLAAVQLPAVWFLVFSWWLGLTSVLPIQADTARIYTLCFFFTAILVAIWNAPLRAARKGILLILLLCLAVSWIRRHLDAAVNVLNLTANAYLTVRKPDAYPYPIQTVPELQMALMFAIFLLPLLFVWSLILHIRKGKFFAFLLLLAPAAFALIITEVPSEMSCWLLLLSGAVYMAVCGCREGRAALAKGSAAACILTVLILLSALGSRPLEQYKQPSDSFYARTRESIETGWIKPLQDSYEQARAEWNAREQPAQENESNPENGPDAENKPDLENKPDFENAPDSESSDGDLQSSDDPDQPEQVQNTPDSTQETDTQTDFTVETSKDAAHRPLFPTENNTANDGNTSGRESAGISGGGTDDFPDLGRLSYFQPDTDTRLTLTLDYKPEETVYYPSAYGIIYDYSRWNRIYGNGDIPLEIYLQYPSNLTRLETLCLEHAPATLADASDFIQKEFEEHTVYNFEPGSTPTGVDFAEYFLFDNRRGFCVHFATTAVLMYRMCGYPARYVQGYAVPASAFHRQEDGSYTAEATGEMGHAWCEVSENGEWILKEHTLPYYGARPESGIPATSSSGRTWIRNAAGWSLLILKICAVGFVCILAAILLFFIQAALRRQRKYRKFCTISRGAGIQRMYCAIYDTAVFQGMEKTDILSLEGFQMLRDFLPQIPSDAMEWLYQTVLETMFYQKTVTKEDTKHAWKIYRQFSRMIKKELSPSRRFFYNYIKVL